MSFETPEAQKFDLSVFSYSSGPGVAYIFLFRFVEGFKYVKFHVNLVKGNKFDTDIII